MFYVMNVRIEKAFAKLESQRQFIVQKIGVIPEVRYHTSPADKWAVSQVLTHLITSEQLSVNYMKKKALGIENADDSGIVESLKMILLKVSQRLPLKYQAPKIIIENTPQPFSLDAAITHWQACRIELRDLADGIPDRHIRKKIFKHPLAGRFDVIQAMDFFYEHINHHWPQIKRLM